MPSASDTDPWKTSQSEKLAYFGVLLHDKSCIFFKTYFSMHLFFSKMKFLMPWLVTTVLPACLKLIPKIFVKHSAFLPPTTLLYVLTYRNTVQHISFKLLSKYVVKYTTVRAPELKVAVCFGGLPKYSAQNTDVTHQVYSFATQVSKTYSQFFMFM